MKTTEELGVLAQWIYDDVEHGQIKEAVRRLDALYSEGMTDAAEEADKTRILGHTQDSFMHDNGTSDAVRVIFAARDAKAKP